MTVAAVILSARPEGSLELVDGVPRVRRLVDVAWSGGAVPIVVVSADLDGGVAAALAGAPVTLAAPAPIEGGPVGQVLRGVTVAVDEVHDTDAILIWPARMQWVDPETITSLIEAHGTDRTLILRPAFNGEPGWPVLVPTAVIDGLRNVGADRMPDEIVADLVHAGSPERVVELGDPGVTHDASVERHELPAFHGPAEPASGHVHEWGSVAADRSDDAPLDGPALVPYGSGATEDPDRPGG